LSTSAIQPSSANPKTNPAAEVFTGVRRGMEERYERAERFLEWPVMIAALLVIPVVVQIRQIADQRQRVERALARRPLGGRRP
jgi:hypothetical protein